MVRQATATPPSAYVKGVGADEGLFVQQHDTCIGIGTDWLAYACNMQSLLGDLAFAAVLADSLLDRCLQQIDVQERKVEDAGGDGTTCVDSEPEQLALERET